MHSTLIVHISVLNCQSVVPKSNNQSLNQSINCNQTHLFSDCAPFSVTNGALSTDLTSHGTNVTVTCDPGYTISGNKALTCHDGTWGGDPPICIQGIT